MKRGIVFTMDAVFALYISLIFLSTIMFMLESTKNYSDDSLALSRLSRDLYEIRQYDPNIAVPSFIKTGSACDSAPVVGATQAMIYGDIQAGSWTTKTRVFETTIKVCPNV